MRITHITILIAAMLAGPAAARTAPHAVSQAATQTAKPAAPATGLAAEEIGRWPAPEALQGTAVDAEHFYAVVNYAIGKYRKSDGEKVAAWRGGKGGPHEHLNSCYADADRLVCAHSNFPDLPMASSIEYFDKATLAPAGSRALGFALGSLTWAEKRGDEWWAGFANYDGKGGEPNRPHTYGSVARFDAEWRLLEQWLLPETVLERMAPHSASGGAFGPDGLLYLMGHDRKELYAVALPEAGVRLVHRATIAVNAEGQAFAWDRSQPEARILYAISRPNREVRAFRIPTLPPLDGE